MLTQEINKKTSIIKTELDFTDLKHREAIWLDLTLYVKPETITLKKLCWIIRRAYNSIHIEDYSSLMPYSDILVINHQDERTWDLKVGRSKWSGVTIELVVSFKENLVEEFSECSARKKRELICFKEMEDLGLKLKSRLLDESELVNVMKSK